MNSIIYYYYGEKKYTTAQNDKGIKEIKYVAYAITASHSETEGALKIIRFFDIDLKNLYT
jgi:hypothetical protein